MTIIAKQMINVLNVATLKQNYLSSKPFNHIVIDNFLQPETAIMLEDEFPNYESDIWHLYSNAVEQKKTCNNWNLFSNLTYALFTELSSSTFIDLLSELTTVNLYADIGLHGGGWHIHESGGNLNPHLDYSIHPKLGMQRKLNIIIYLSSKLKPMHGGQLGLWETVDGNSPSKLAVEVEPIFNRAIIFDTTQNSWHGMSRTLNMPPGIFRKSIAMYYLCEPAPGADNRKKALFAPRENQVGDTDVHELIKQRADQNFATSVYRKNK